MNTKIVLKNRFYRYFTLFSLLFFCYLLSSCSIFYKKTIPQPPIIKPSHPTTKQTGGLVLYTASNIHGYENAPIYIDSDFVQSMNQINQYAIDNDVTIVVTSSFRKKDAKLTGTIVSPAKMSNHLSGHAIDMNILFDGTLYDSKELREDNLINLPFNVVSFIEEIRINPDLRWGGDFKTEDPVHIDDNLNSDHKAWQERYEICQAQDLQNVKK